MKKLFAIVFLIGLWLPASAQFSEKNKAITAGYLGHSAIFPGGNVGLMIDVKDWQIEKTKGDASIVKNRSLFVHPQLGLYSRRRKYSSIFFNTEVGVRKQKDGRRFYSAYSLGLGYVGRSEIMSLTVNFNGEITAKERELRSYFMPNINYQIGVDFTDNFSFYSKASYGMKLSPTRERSGNFYLGLGFKFKLASKSAE